MEQPKVFVATAPAPNSSTKTILFAVAGVAIFGLMGVGLLAGNKKAEPKKVARSVPAETTPQATETVEWNDAVKPPPPPPEVNAQYAIAEADKRREEWAEKNKDKIAAHEKKVADTKAAEQKKITDVVEKEAAKVEAEAAKAEKKKKVDALVRGLMEKGSLEKYDGSKYWVNPREWRACNRDVKETLVNLLATHQELHTGRRIATILSFQDDALLAETTWTGSVKIHQ